jgi:acyl-coenzyme A thioesterase PaaI-like protein
MTDDIPAGFTPHFRKSPVTDAWEPIFSKTEGGVVVIALRVRQAHCNGRGFLHGGVVSALADNAMGLSVIESLRQQEVTRSRGGLTVSLALDFLASAQIGQWIEIVPRVLKTGSSLGFVDCVVLADRQPIARGNATFRFYDVKA